MAKRKNTRLSTTKAECLTSNASSIQGFTEYEPYVIIKTNHDLRSFKVWFEKNDDHMVNTTKEKMRLCKGKKSSDWIVEDRQNVAVSFSKDVARAFAFWLKQELPSYSSITNAMRQICRFMAFIDANPLITDISELTNKVLLAFESHEKDRASYFKTILKLHPRVDFSELEYSFKKRRKNYAMRGAFQNKREPLNEVEAFSLAEFSEREHFQLVGFVMHRIDLITKRRTELFEADAEPLRKIGCLLEDSYSTTFPNKREFLPGRSAASRIRKLHDKDPKMAIDLLHSNMMLLARDGSNSGVDFTGVVNSLRQSTSVYGKGLFNNYLAHLEILYEPTNLSVASKDRTRFKNYKRTIVCRTPLNEIALILAIIIQTGVNLEVVTSLKRYYGGRHWTKNFDIDIDTKNSQRMKVVRLVGIKRKMGVAPPKEISIRVPVDSHLFRVLILYEEIFSVPGSDLFFSGMHVGNAKRDFCSVYKIKTDDGDSLTSIDTTKIRKSFAGAKLAKLVEESESGEELERRLRESLNHKSFDTTIFSYLMKSGTGHLVYSSAVIALTNKMLQDAIAFKGKLFNKNKKQPSSTKIPVYLCDCSDPKSPTHGIPIANQCKQYDLCLGCERSEVYAEHIPRICYRILQYEKVPQPIDIILADRKAIALDCLAKFESAHPYGAQIIERGYQLANQAVIDNKPLLPPIL